MAHIAILSNNEDVADSNTEVSKDLVEISSVIATAITELGHSATVIGATQDSLSKLHVFDSVFNICERFEGSHRNKAESDVASLLEQKNVFFTGSSAKTIELCNNKAAIKKILVEHSIQTPNFQIFRTGLEPIRSTLKYPLIVKPTLEHNSIGITEKSVVRSEKELKKQVAAILAEFEQPVIAEEFISGKDVEIGVVGKHDAKVFLPPAQVEYKNFNGNKADLFFHYDSKWNTASDKYGDYVFVDSIPEETQEKMRNIAGFLYDLLDIHDYGRIDFRLDEHNNPYVIEICVNPGLSDVCSLPQGYKAVGKEYRDLISDVLSSAFERREKGVSIDKTMRLK